MTREELIKFKAELAALGITHGTFIGCIEPEPIPLGTYTAASDDENNCEVAPQ